jgi:hypothetical protein
MQGETQSMQAQQLEQQQQQQKQEAVQQQQVQHEQEHNGRNHGSSRKASAGKIEQDVHGDALSTNGSQDDGEHVEETKSDRASTAPAETATTAASDTDRLAASPVTSGAARRVKLEPIASDDQETDSVEQVEGGESASVHFQPTLTAQATSGSPSDTANDMISSSSGSVDDDSNMALDVSLDLDLSSEDHAALFDALIADSGSSHDDSADSDSSEDSIMSMMNSVLEDHDKAEQARNSIVELPSTSMFHDDLIAFAV